MVKTKELLNEAIEYFGMNDIVTIMLSQKLDKMIVEAQKEGVKYGKR